QRKRLQGLAELALHDCIEETYALHFTQFEAAHAVGAPQVEQLRLDDAVLADLHSLLFNTNDGAIESAGLSRVGLLKYHLDLLAARLCQDSPETWVAGQVDGEALQGAFDRD